eukprot:jgi/Bigna1/49129/estExt_Genewise1.C_400018
MAENKETTIKYFAAMSCSGCSNAITKIAKKIEGVKEVICDLDKKSVVIKGTMDEKTVTTKLAKWSKASGKEVRLLDE